VAKFVDKGARIGVVGQLQIDSWTDKASGEERNRAKVIVRDLDILESRAEADLRRSGRRASYSDEDEFEDGPMSAGTGGFFNDR
jgi:single-stranded DNA-binding protein